MHITLHSAYITDDLSSSNKIIAKYKHKSLTISFHEDGFSWTGNNSFLHFLEFLDSVTVEKLWFLVFMFKSHDNFDMMLYNLPSILSPLTKGLKAVASHNPK